MKKYLVINNTKKTLTSAAIEHPVGESELVDLSPAKIAQINNHPDLQLLEIAEGDEKQAANKK